MPQETPEGMSLTLRTLAMPADTNAAGDIFGGWVMSQMDLAAAIRANERCNGRTVTVAANEIVFNKAVKVGDTLCVYTAVEHVTEAQFTMVAVDKNGNPRPVEAV